jgi:hypothetical protein
MTTRHVSHGAVLTSRTLAVVIALGCAGSAEGGPIDLVLLDRSPPSEPQPLGSLSVDLSCRRAETGAAVASVWPLVTDAGSTCPLDCARQVGECPPECSAVAIGTNDVASWPGTNVVTLAELQPRSYWLSAYLMRGADHRDGPWPADPVSRDSPVLVQVASGQTAHASLSLDALRAGATVTETSRCPLPNAGTGAFGQVNVGDFRTARDAGERNCSSAVR